MSVNDLLKAHMDAVRNITPTNDKLSISDATEMLKKPQLADAFPLDTSNLTANQADHQSKNGIDRVTSLVNNHNVGVYLSYPNELSSKNCIFECLIRGTFILNRLGDEGSRLIYQGQDIHLDEKTWKILRVPFHCTLNSAFDLYGNATKGQWFEISQPCFVKMS